MKLRQSTDIAVVIPCYNEAATVQAVIEEFRSAVPTCRIFVCDNNSTDGTAERARAAGATVVREPRQGKGHAVRRLFADVSAEVYLLVDGDLTYHAQSAPRMVRTLVEDRLDMVVGSRREVDEGESRYRPGHRFGNRLFTGTVRLLFGHGFEDLLSGYRCMSRRFVKSFPPLTTGFDIETELAVHALTLNLPFAEVDTPYRGRPAGSNSKLSTYSDGFRIALRILQLLKAHRPALFFGGLSATLLLLSMLLGVPVILEFFETGLVPRFPTAILASALGVIGFLFASAGVVLSSVAHARDEAKWLTYLQHQPVPTAIPIEPAGELHSSGESAS